MTQQYNIIPTIPAIAVTSCIRHSLRSITSLTKVYSINSNSTMSSPSFQASLCLY
jgi:hypothetical protein